MSQLRDPLFGITLSSVILLDQLNCSPNSGDYVTIIDSVIASNVEIKSNVTIQKGCVIANNVIVGAGINLPPFTKLTTSDAAMTERDLGEGGVGGEYAPKKRPEFGTEFVPQDWEQDAKEEFDDDSDDSDGEVHENQRTST